MKKKLLSFFALCAFGGLLILKPSLVGMIEYLKKTNRPVLQKHEEHAQEVARDAHIAELRKQLGEAKTQEAKNEILRQLVDLDSAVQRLVPAKACNLSKKFTDFLRNPLELPHNDWVYLVAFSPDGSRLATGSSYKKARIWDVNSGKMLYDELPHEDEVRSVAFSPDGSRLATGSLDKKARVWDANSGNMLYELPHNGWVESVAFSPDGSRLATGSLDKKARVWDVNSGKMLYELPHGSVVAFSPDGSRLATGSEDHKARVWDANSGNLLYELPHGSVVAFSPDGSRLATGSLDKKARVWDANSGNMLYELPHNGWVESVAFSPDGSRLATGSLDKKARVWDVNSGNMLYELPHDKWVNSVAFSPDGSRLATGSDDKKARIWDVPTLEALASPSRAQCDLLQAFSMLYSREKLGKAPAPIQATCAQWYTFQTFPIGVQKLLQKYIVAPEKEKDFYDSDKEKGKEKE